jgi:hypothetical protein
MTYASVPYLSYWWIHQPSMYITVLCKRISHVGLECHVSGIMYFDIYLTL